MVLVSLKKCMSKRCKKMNANKECTATTEPVQIDSKRKIISHDCFSVSPVKNPNSEEHIAEKGNVKLLSAINVVDEKKVASVENGNDTLKEVSTILMSVGTSTDFSDSLLNTYGYPLSENESEEVLVVEKSDETKENEVAEGQKLTVDVGTNTHLPNNAVVQKTKSFNSLNNVKSNQQIVTYDSEKTTDYVCSLYVTACPTIVRLGDVRRDPVNRQDLDEAIKSIKPCGIYKVTETKCGLIASFANEIDADNLLLNLNLAQALHGPVQVARFSRRDTRYKQIATLRDVPWSIPMQDICTALTFQGISYENVDRFRNNVRVEVLDAMHYENLISQGLNFFDAARFVAVPERWYRNTGQSSVNGNEPSHSSESDTVLQCYRCQGFWHVAANCRHLPRCVRCGEPHGVEFCPRPRNNPICCHCSGAHHAAYKNCPVRVQLGNAFPVSMSLSTVRNNESPREIRSRCRS